MAFRDDVPAAVHMDLITVAAGAADAAQYEGETETRATEIGRVFQRIGTWLDRGVEAITTGPSAPADTLGQDPMGECSLCVDPFRAADLHAPTLTAAAAGTPDRQVKSVRREQGGWIEG